MSSHSRHGNRYTNLWVQRYISARNEQRYEQCSEHQKGDFDPKHIAFGSISWLSVVLRKRPQITVRINAKCREERHKVGCDCWGAPSLRNHRNECQHRSITLDVPKSNIKSSSPPEKINSRGHLHRERRNTPPDTPQPESCRIDAV